MNERGPRRIATLVLACAFGLMCAMCARADDGAGVYKAKCAACHGADGSGNTPVGKSMHLRDLSSADVQKQTDAELNAMITNGKGSMPGYKGKITDDQIRQLVTFIRGLAKKS